MVFSLQFLREREEKAAADVAERVNAEKSRAIAASAGFVAGPAPPPSPPHRQTVEELTKKVDAIRAEKDELASELRALQDISQRERDITKDLRKMHQMDLEEIGSQMQVTLSEIERFQKLAVDREARVKELQLRLVKRKEQRISRAGVPGLPVGARADVVSEGGFSNLSDIVDMKNALDFYVTSGQIEERALLELPRQGAILSQVPPASSLVTLVLAEFMHYDVGSSETAGGLRPRYDSLLSFGPFEVGDPEVEHFAKGSLRLELQAFSSGGSAAYVLGRASLPLAALLDCCPQDPNPVVAGTLYFASEEDSRVQIAAVRYKARWRRSIIQELESYTIRRGVTPLAVADAEVAGHQLFNIQHPKHSANTAAMIRRLWIGLAVLGAVRLAIHMQRSVTSTSAPWCFANPDSINGPFIQLQRLHLIGLDLVHVASTTLREPGWQCSTMALGRPGGQLQGPALCRSLLPITRQLYWNNVTIHGTPGAKLSGDNCSSCTYLDLPIGGPWPRISCDALNPHPPKDANLQGWGRFLYCAGRPAAPGLLEAAKGLIVQIFNATCLVPAQQMPAEALQPYASYEVPGHKIHFTATGTGANVSFEDISRMVVRVDRDFCRQMRNH
eukprot:symbB.v1.2.015116.t1/scaffold1119.1/size136827/5